MIRKFGSQATDVIKSVIKSRLTLETAQIKPEVSK